MVCFLGEENHKMVHLKGAAWGEWLTGEIGVFS